MTRRLSGRRVALLVTNGFEQIEVIEPKRRLSEQGARVELVSLRKSKVRAWNHSDWGEELDVDVHLEALDPAACDALVLPGGVLSSDLLRLDQRAVDLAAAFVDAGKVVAAIGHGAWLLIEANRVRARRVTSYLSLRTDLTNAGARWEDAPVVVDERLIFSRWPDDLEPFCDAIIEALSSSGDRSVDALL